MSLINAKAISWFPENLPEEQMIEDKFKKIIRDNYNASGFVSIETSVVEREDVLTSKWANDNEIYGIHRLNWEKWSDSWLWLRFDLTVPLARYVAQNDNNLVYPFKRQQIQKVYRWERPQKWRYREFYQADIDIIWNWKLSLFADSDIISTLNNALKALEIPDYTIHINNKKLLFWFLDCIGINQNIQKIISIIDKKDKIDKDDNDYTNTWKLLKEEVSDKVIFNKLIKYIQLWNINNNQKILKFFDWMQNDVLLEWIKELKYIYESLIWLWIDDKIIKLNPSITRGLNYYTWTVFETFIKWYEDLWSFSSGWRYEDLVWNFSKNSFPWVGWSIWLSRLLVILNEIWRLDKWRKTPTEVLVLNFDEKYIKEYIDILKILRQNNINSELFLDPNIKLLKQFKYAENKGIPLSIIIWEDEVKKWTVLIKNMKNREQFDIKKENIVKKIKEII